VATLKDDDIAIEAEKPFVDVNDLPDAVLYYGAEPPLTIPHTIDEAEKEEILRFYKQRELVRL
jgi:hypothetical protein